MWTGEGSHLHFEKTAVKQAFCLLQLVQLLCSGGSVQVTPGHLHRMVDHLLTRLPLGFASFTFNGASILVLHVRGKAFYGIGAAILYLVVKSDMFVSVRIFNIIICIYMFND